MIRLRKLALLIGILVFSPQLGIAADLSGTYLHGKWTMEGAENCGKPEFEAITFKSDGTIIAQRFGKTTLTGFWETSGEILKAHIITSPAHLDRLLMHMQGHFDYYLVKMLVVKSEQDAFKVVGTIGDQMRSMSLHRCGS